MRFSKFETKGITERQHLIEGYIDDLRGHYEVSCELDLDSIKNKLLFAKTEERFNDLLEELENAVKSYQEDEIIMIGEEDDE